MKVKGNVALTVCNHHSYYCSIIIVLVTAQNLISKAAMQTVHALNLGMKYMWH